MKLLRMLCFAMALVVTPLAGWAHGDDDHGDAPTPLPAPTSAPRAEAQTTDFELVVAPQGPSLLLFLDRFASNEPVSDAEVTVQSKDLQATAVKVAPGTYRVTGEPWTRPGTHALTISVQTPEASDLLSVTLNMPAPAVETVDKTWTGGRTGWLLAGATLLLALAAVFVVAVVWQRRRKSALS